MKARVKRIFRLHGYYQILDDSPLVVYNKRVPHVQYHYGQTPYFSLSLASAKYKLTKKNLRKYVTLSRDAEKKIIAVKDRKALADIFRGKCLVNELILTSRELISNCKKKAGLSDLLFERHSLYHSTLN